MPNLTTAQLVAILTSGHTPPAPEEPTSQDPLPAPRLKKRGGQPGNRNALKHGFYARAFRPADLRDLNRHNFSDLQDEIIMLRVFIRHVLELGSTIEDFNQAIILLRVLTLASVGLTRLFRVRHLISGRSDDLTLAFNQLLSDVNRELKEPPSAPNHSVE